VSTRCWIGASVLTMARHTASAVRCDTRRIRCSRESRSMRVSSTCPPFALTIASSFPSANLAARLLYRQALAAVASALDLPASIGTAATLPPRRALSEQFVKRAPTSMVGFDVLVDVLVARQPRGTRDLLRAVIPAQQGLDLWPVRRIDPRLSACALTPAQRSCEGRLRRVARCTSIPFELATDGAG